MKIRILIADDHEILRDGLRALIEKEQNLKCIGEAENGRKAVKLARELKPDIIIMDVAMPALGGIEATRQITNKIPGVKLIALSMHSDKRFVTGMLKAGASGYLLKDSAFEEVVNAICTVVSNHIYISPGIIDIVVEDYIHHLSKDNQEEDCVLTAREREVLQLIAEGKDMSYVSSHLYISIKTVEKHRQNIMEKLDIHNVAELTKYAIRKGLASLEP